MKIIASIIEMQQYSIQMTFTELEPVFNDEYPNDNDSSVGF